MNRVIWEHIGTPVAKLWLVCTRQANGKLKPVLIPFGQAYQEDYAETEDQHEGVLNAFTTPGGADRYMQHLVADGEQAAFEVKRIGVDEFLKLIKGIDEAYRIVKHHSIRVDIYDVRSLTPTRELLYSRWVPKH